MKDDTVFDLIAIIAGLIAWSYVFGMWRMVRARSRLVLLVAVSFMVLTRIAFIVGMESHVNWVAQHRALIGMPVYVLLAAGFGATYYELRDFHFDVPKEKP